MKAPPEVVIASTSLAAHLLVEAGSGVVRARELLELVTWPDGDGGAIASALSTANRAIQGVRMLVDAHASAMIERVTGRPPISGPQSIALARELLREPGSEG